MKSQLPSAEQMEELLQMEEELARSLTVDGCLELAGRYSRLGMDKDAQRLIQAAEQLEHLMENHGISPDNLLSGDLSPSMLVEVLQILSRTLRSGELILESPPEECRIFFKQGRIIHALSASEAPGQDSFFKALRLSEGSYRFVENNALDVEPMIETKTDHLILEAIRLMDESNKGSDG